METVSQAVLDNLFNQECIAFKDRNCPDCSVFQGQPHVEGCDVSRCLECGSQRVSCDCESMDGAGDIWDGIWPGMVSAYEQKMTYTHLGQFKLSLNSIDTYTMLLERRQAKFNADKAALKVKHQQRMAEFAVGEVVEYFGTMDPLDDLKGSAVINHIGWLCEEPVCWLENVSGGWSMYAIRKLEAKG